VEALEQLLYAFKANLDKAKRDELLVDRLSSYEKRVTVLKNVAHPEVNLVEVIRQIFFCDPDFPNERFDVL
jgi:hypothetical protein